MSKITIKDVAREAGVSVSAVSHVLNDYPDISSETRKKVLEAVSRLDYIPNNAARQLSSKKKKVIALILNEINVTRGVAMPLEILGGVVDALDDTTYEFVFYAVNTKRQNQKTLKQFCNEHDITGVIIQGLRVTDPYYKELETFELPTVVIDMFVENENVGSVSTDNHKAAADVTSRLLKAGYKKILFVNGSKDAVVSKERERGYREKALSPEVRYADFSEEKAYALIESLENPQQYDAIFAASDLMAIGIIKALTVRQLERSIAVVGFDDITLASYITPTLTTVRQNIGLFTEKAVQDLLLQIETGQVIQRYIPYDVVVRESAKI